MSDTKENINFTIQLLSWIRTDPKFKATIKAGLPIEIFPHFKINIYHRNNDALDSIFYRFDINSSRVDGTFNKGYLKNLLSNPSFKLFPQDEDVLKRIKEKLSKYEDFHLAYQERK
jgi:hypothetical protein